MHSLLQAQNIILSRRSELKTLFESFIPDDFFDKRQRANAPKEKREEAAIRHQILREMEFQAESHICSISDEKIEGLKIR